MRRKYLSVLLLLGFYVASTAEETSESLFVEGYAGEVSYAPGETLQLHTSTRGQSYAISIIREGLKDEVVYSKKGISGASFPIPEGASSVGCDWPVSYEMEIPEDWKSGYYRVSFSTADSGGKYVHRGQRTASSDCYFVLRSGHPGRDTKILLQLATNTYNAYNNWGGSSLYGFHGRHGLQGHQVSFLRPPRSLFSRWEKDFVKWAEKNGYELDYCSNMDLALRPEIVDEYQLILSVGHDEYWSWEMRDTAEAFAAKGGNLAFFSGNTCCWQVRYEAETQSLECWKQWYNQDSAFTAEDKSRLTSLWSHHLVGRTENSMTGVGFIHGGYHRSHGQHMEGSGAFQLHRSNHWLFEGTGLKPGDDFGGEDTIVGYECDGCEIEWRDDLPFPTHKDGTPEGFTIFATAPATWAPGDSIWYEKWPSLDHTGHAVMGAYETKGGGTVFTCGSTDWAHGLKREGSPVDLITAHLLRRLSKRP
jgi:hypothetical protein